MVKKMRKSRFWAFLGRKQYVIAGAIVIAAAVATTVIYSDHEQQQREQLEEELAQENTPEEAGLVAATESTEQTAQASAVIPPEQTAETEKLEQKAAETTESTEVAQVKKEAENETAETGAGVNALHFDPEDGMLWPMEGNVILNYSMDSTIYFATLDQYKYNPAVIIAGEVNNKVYSVAKGKVIGLSNNEETGCTMTVDLGDGYRAIYGQLKEPNFAVGDYVESGHVQQSVFCAAKRRTACRSGSIFSELVCKRKTPVLEYVGFLHYNETRDKGGIGTWNSRNTVKL